MTEQQSYAHLHFASEAEASSFYYTYRNNNHVVCKQIEDMLIKPSRVNGKDISYDISLYQQRINGGLNETWYKCTVPAAAPIVVPAAAPIAVPADALIAVPDLKRKIKEPTDEIKRDENALQSGFVHEDGMGGTFGDQGNHISIIQMEVNDKGDPLENVTNFDKCTHLKPPERDINYVKEETDEGRDDKDTVMKTIQTFRSYKPSKKEMFFYLVFEKGKRVRAAALELRVSINALLETGSKKIKKILKER